MSTPASNAGYGEAAEFLVGQYESITFEDVHGDVLSLFPAAPARVADIGAGSGRDAAALARRGYEVTAVEPTRELREAGRQIHADAAIRWIDDGLPDLPTLSAEGGSFHLLLLTAVWMHLDEAERARAMRSLAALLAPGGRISMSLRHGPVPEGRRMFDVPAHETVELGQRFGLAPVKTMARKDVLGRGDVSWSFVVLEKPGIHGGVQGGPSSTPSQACHTP